MTTLRANRPVTRRFDRTLVAEQVARSGPVAAPKLERFVAANVTRSIDFVSGRVTR